MKIIGTINDLMDISGIYKIICVCNGRFYIGSSGNLRKRFTAHRAALRQNKHKALRMQNSWNKYGEDAFLFEVLERCPNESLMIREQFYIDTLNPCDNSIGFNVCPIAGDNTGRPMSDKTKKRISLANLGKKRSPEAVARIISGQKRVAESTLHKIWTTRGLDFSLVSPTGKLFIGKGLAPFAREHGLNMGNLAALVTKKTHQYRGWTREGDSKKMYKVKDPFGVSYDIYPGDVSAFVRKHKISRGLFWMMCNGQIEHAKGWCLTKNKKAYVTLINDDTKDLVSTCRYNLRPFRKKYSVSRHINCVINGKRPAANGWRLI